MKKVREILVIIEDWDIYSRYGMINILCHLYKLHSNNELQDMLLDEAFLDKDLSFDDLVIVVKHYQGKMGYENSGIQNDVTYFNFCKFKDKSQDKGGHVISGFEPFRHIVKSVNDFIISGGKTDKLSQSVAPYLTKNVNPFVSEYQTYDMYMICSNIITTITTDKFSRVFCGILPDLKSNVDYLLFFEYVIKNINNTVYLNNIGNTGRKGVLRPNHFFQNYTDIIKWFIKDYETEKMKYLNLNIHIAGLVGTSKIKEILLHTTWYIYSVGSVKTFKIDYQNTKVIYDNYKNINDDFMKYEYKKLSDAQKYIAYQAFIAFMERPSYDNMNKMLACGLTYKYTNKFINNYINNLKMEDSLKTESLNIGKQLSVSAYYVYKEKYSKDKDMLKTKISTLKSEIKRCINVCNTVYDVFEYLTDLSAKHKGTNFIYTPIDKFLDLSKEDLKIFKQLVVISMYTISKKEEEETVNILDELED